LYLPFCFFDIEEKEDLHGHHEAVELERTPETDRVN
jgi:hypothetical protein